MFSAWSEIDWLPLWLTLKVASIATLIAFMIGIALGYLLARTQFWGKEVLDAFLTLPMVLPPTVLGFYLLTIFGKKGWLGGFLLEHFNYTLIFNWHGAVIASAVVSYPLVFKSARAAFEGVDANFENVAKTLGQNRIAVFLRVTFPLAWRGILAGTMLAFARAMGEFGATLMVAGNIPERTQTLSLAVYDAVQAGNDSLANVLVLITSIVCITVLVIASRLLKSNHW
ncbi:molybdate ABC transporter, permease protein [Beggiatoa alba B18LD]|uniref:Molybdenum transport system permease n=1 Tax=Beggiatoa alba B18LD TaxID=395493 RepID=I3CI12_9GAMM|nr:molybdate ABC transporter permease subunit [Beggiatoa alba]EIJ43255.1 molybdate ABC transporter, permease protein [Beggiatoa alba B18LD]